MTKEELIMRYVENKYKELSSPQGELTPEGRGYLVALGDIIRFYSTLETQSSIAPNVDDAALQFVVEKSQMDGGGVRGTGDIGAAFKAGFEYVMGNVTQSGTI